MGEFRIGRFTRHVYAFLLLLIFMTPAAHADVTITNLTQDPAGDLIQGDNPVYTLTLDNAVGQPTAFDVTVSITIDGENSSSLFTSQDCPFDVSNGNFSCNNPNDQFLPGTTRNYQFTWIDPPPVGDNLLSFDVGCFLSNESECAVVSESITTTVIPAGSASLDIPPTVIPGETALGTLTVVDTLATTIITTDNPDSTVTPGTLPAGGGVSTIS